MSDLKNRQQFQCDYVVRIKLDYLNDRTAFILLVDLHDNVKFQIVKPSSLKDRPLQFSELVRRHRDAINNFGDETGAIR